MELALLCFHETFPKKFFYFVGVFFFKKFLYGIRMYISYIHMQTWTGGEKKIVKEETPHPP